MVQINTTPVRSTNYFLFYHESSFTIDKETIQQLIFPIIKHEKAEILMDLEGTGFEIIVYSRETQQKLLSNPITLNGKQLFPSLKSRKICNKEPCTRRATCFYSHVSTLDCPLFSSKVRAWAVNYWKSEVENLVQLDDSIVIQSDKKDKGNFGIQVPSEFYEQILPFPIFYDSISAAHRKVSFKTLSSHLEGIEKDSFYMYNWNADIFILSHIKDQLKPIKKALLQILSKSGPYRDTKYKKEKFYFNNPHSQNNSKNSNKNHPKKQEKKQKNPSTNIPCASPPLQETSSNLIPSQLFPSQTIPPQPFHQPSILTPSLYPAQQNYLQGPPQYQQVTQFQYGVQQGAQLQYGVQQGAQQRGGIYGGQQCGVQQQYYTASQQYPVQHQYQQLCNPTPFNLAQGAVGGGIVYPFYSNQQTIPQPNGNQGISTQAFAPHPFPLVKN